MDLKRFLFLSIPSFILLGKLYLWIIGAPIDIDAAHWGAIICFCFINMGLAFGIACISEKNPKSRW